MFIVIVCTGNTCRSPMAEAMLRRLVAERLGCTPAEIEQRGVIDPSAGVSAAPGGCAAPEAVETMRQRGLDISRHESQPLTEKLVRHADVILTLTGAHRQAIVRRWPEAAPRTHDAAAGRAATSTTRSAARRGVSAVRAADRGSAAAAGGGDGIASEVRCHRDGASRRQLVLACDAAKRLATAVAASTRHIPMRFAIGSDHRGYHLKEQIIAMLRTKGHEVDDEGACGSRERRLPRLRRAGGEEGEPGRRRARHPHLRHRHRHGDRRQQVPRRARRPVQRRSDRRDQPPAQQPQRAVPLGRHAQPADRRADGRGVGRARRSKAAGTSGGWRRSTSWRRSCAERNALGWQHWPRGERMVTSAGWARADR